MNIEDTYYYKLYECYGELIRLGFDFEKNSARDFIECLIYLYNELFLEEEEEESN